MTAPVADRILLQQLLVSWHRENAYLFGQSMRAPAMQLSGNTQELASWRAASRTIQVSRALIQNHPWSVVEEVLRHEMAHQYVTEVLHITDESAHGPAFQATCAARGIDGTAKGLPVARAMESEDGKMIARIQRLLALAQSDNAHEAESAAQAAQRLMLKHNIDLSQRRGATYTSRRLGEPTGRRPSYTKLLSGILTEHYFVEGVWVDSFDASTGKSGMVFEVLGTPENIEIAAYVWDFLLQAAEQQWLAHKRATNKRADADRRAFLNGVMIGFRVKLDSQKVVSQQEGLVWVGDPELQRYLRRRFPSLVTGSGFTLGNASAYNEGKAAGASIVLHKGVGSDGGNQGRLLGTKS